ncbi:MAG TPA: ribose 5-phosphate isomerase B, partial [Acidobacteriota bacterium]|nr:ribose 5-phosphate isomerase B [Acidobacteriota bacterium]
KKILESLSVDYVDLGPQTAESTDYPDFAAKVADAVQKGDRGILCCGTGIGMSITANKFTGVRAAVCNDLFSAKMSREHNDANVLAIGARILSESPEVAEIVRVWLETPFEGGRHQRRLDKIRKYEQEQREKDLPASP